MVKNHCVLYQLIDECNFGILSILFILLLGKFSSNLFYIRRLDYGLEPCLRTEYGHFFLFKYNFDDYGLMLIIICDRF